MSAAFEELKPDAWLEAVLYLKRTGLPIATWTRHSAQKSVLEVMAATMVGSVETLLEALGCSTPQSIMLEADEHRVLVTRCGAQTSLVLVTSRTVGEAVLRHESLRILRQLTSSSGGPSRGHDALATP